MADQIEADNFIEMEPGLPGVFVSGSHVTDRFIDILAGRIDTLIDNYVLQFRS